MGLLSPLFLLPAHHEVSSFLQHTSHHDVRLLQAQKQKPTDDGLEPLKPWTKISLLSHEVGLSQMFQ
jgi:hypothetical protein